MSSTAIAAGAAASAAGANSRAKDALCKTIVEVSTPKLTTAAEKQEYAECVERLYPDAMSPGEAVFVKVLIASAIIGCVAGAWLAEDSYDKVMAAICGMLLGPIIVLFIMLVWICLTFLFS